MDLINYSVKDFILNESFQKWILQTDIEAKLFWEDWLNTHPDKIELITEARSMIQSITETHEQNLEGECDEVWRMITESIHDLDSDAMIKKIREIENTP